MVACRFRREHLADVRGAERNGSKASRGTASIPQLLSFDFELLSLSFLLLPQLVGTFTCMLGIPADATLLAVRLLLTTQFKYRHCFRTFNLYDTTRSSSPCLLSTVFLCSPSSVSPSVFILCRCQRMPRLSSRYARAHRTIPTLLTIL